MTIEFTGVVEEQLRDLALRQGRDMRVLVEEAVREYLEAEAITDVSAADVGESQITLAAELRGVPEWKDGRSVLERRGRMKSLSGA